MFCSYTVFGQVLKYKSLNYDIEKPNVAAYATKYVTTFHTVDLNKNTIKYVCGNVSKTYSVQAIYDEGTYFRFSINSSGVKNIWVSRSLSSGNPYNIEYEFLSGIKFIYYEITQFQ